MEGIIAMNHVSYDNARLIMGKNIIGPEELSCIKLMRFKIPEQLPVISFSMDELLNKKDDYLLILGLSNFDNGEKVTIRNIKASLEKNVSVSEPCFYNQDWYERENFIDCQMREGWFLIRKNVYEESRGVFPQELINKFTFPSAVSCVYAFFTAWLTKDIRLWYHDYVWCIDTDHNGDRIYVGKYHDVDGINKDGFSIHRHLSLRSCYGCVD